MEFRDIKAAVGFHVERCSGISGTTYSDAKFSDESNIALEWIVQKCRESRGLTIKGLINQFKEYFTSENSQKRKESAVLLSHVLANCTTLSIGRRNLSSSTKFMCLNLKDPYLLDGILSCFLSLFKNYQKIIRNTKIIPADSLKIQCLIEETESIDVTLQSPIIPENTETPISTVIIAHVLAKVYLPGLHRKIRETTLNLLSHVLSEFKEEMKLLGPQLVFSILRQVEGEKDPRNLTILFPLIELILTQYDSIIDDSQLDLLADTLLRYHPIRFKSSSKDGMVITEKLLNDQFKSALISNTRLSSSSMGYILDVVSLHPSDDGENRLRESLDLLSFCVSRYGGDSAQTFLKQFFEIIRIECWYRQCSMLGDFAETFFRILIVALSTSINLEKGKSEENELSGTEIENTIEVCASTIRNIADNSDMCGFRAAQSIIVVCMMTASTSVVEMIFNYLFPALILNIFKEFKHFITHASVSTTSEINQIEQSLMNLQGGDIILDRDSDVSSMSMLKRSPNMDPLFMMKSQLGLLNCLMLTLFDGALGIASIQSRRERLLEHVRLGFVSDLWKIYFDETSLSEVVNKFRSLRAEGNWKSTFEGFLKSRNQDLTVCLNMLYGMSVQIRQLLCDSTFHESKQFETLTEIMLEFLKPMTFLISLSAFVPNLDKRDHFDKYDYIVSAEKHCRSVVCYCLNLVGFGDEIIKTEIHISDVDISFRKVESKSLSTITSETVFNILSLLGITVPQVEAKVLIPSVLTSLFSLKPIIQLQGNEANFYKLVKKRFCECEVLFRLMRICLFMDNKHWTVNINSLGNVKSENQNLTNVELLLNKVFDLLYDAAEQNFENVVYCRKTRLNRKNENENFKSLPYEWGISDDANFEFVSAQILELLQVASLGQTEFDSCETRKRERICFDILSGNKFDLIKYLEMLVRTSILCSLPEEKSVSDLRFLRLRDMSCLVYRESSSEASLQVFDKLCCWLSRLISRNDIIIEYNHYDSDDREFEKSNLNDSAESYCLSRSLWNKILKDNVLDKLHQFDENDLCYTATRILLLSFTLTGLKSTLVKKYCSNEFKSLIELYSKISDSEIDVDYDPNTTPDDPSLFSEDQNQLARTLSQSCLASLSHLFRDCDDSSLLCDKLKEIQQQIIRFDAKLSYCGVMDSASMKYLVKCGTYFGFIIVASLNSQNTKIKSVGMHYLNCVLDAYLLDCFYKCFANDLSQNGDLDSWVLSNIQLWESRMSLSFCPTELQIEGRLINDNFLTLIKYGVFLCPVILNLVMGSSIPMHMQLEKRSEDKNESEIDNSYTSINTQGVPYSCIDLRTIIENRLGVLRDILTCIDNNLSGLESYKNVTKDDTRRVMLKLCRRSLISLLFILIRWMPLQNVLQIFPINFLARTIELSILIQSDAERCQSIEEGKDQNTITEVSNEMTNSHFIDSAHFKYFVEVRSLLLMRALLRLVEDVTSAYNSEDMKEDDRQASLQLIENLLQPDQLDSKSRTVVMTNVLNLSTSHKLPLIRLCAIELVILIGRWLSKRSTTGKYAISVDDFTQIPRKMSCNLDDKCRSVRRLAMYCCNLWSYLTTDDDL